MACREDLEYWEGLIPPALEEHLHVRLADDVFMCLTLGGELLRMTAGTQLAGDEIRDAVQALTEKDLTTEIEDVGSVRVPFLQKIHEWRIKNGI